MSHRKASLAVLYARYSPRPRKSSEHVEVDGPVENVDTCASCETQLDLCRAYCRTHELRVIGEHRDEGQSGASMDGRPGLAAALDQTLATGAAFVAYSLSRWSRSVADAATISRTLTAAQCDLISVRESIDTRSPHGRLIYNVLASFAEYERDQISQRTSDAMLRLQRAGRRMSDQPPYGYRVDPDHPDLLIPDESEQAAIGFIVALRNDGLGYRGISQRINASPHAKSCRGKRWTPTACERICRREMAK